MNRRAFLGALAALPGLGFLGKREPEPECFKYESTGLDPGAEDFIRARTAPLVIDDTTEPELFAAFERAMRETKFDPLPDRPYSLYRFQDEPQLMGHFHGVPMYGYERLDAGLGYYVTNWPPSEARSA